MVKQPYGSNGNATDDVCELLC